MNVPFKKVRWLPLSKWSHTHLPRRVGFGENGDRSSSVDRLGEQFARRKAFLETGGTQAREQVEIVEVGNLADEGVRIACKGHPASPGTGDGKVLQQGYERDMIYSS